MTALWSVSDIMRGMGKIFRLMFRILLIMFGIGVVTLVAVVLIDAHVARIGRAKIVVLPDVRPADCVIVPGAQVFANGQPSQMLKDRLDVAVAIFKTGRTNRILVSGDHGQVEYDEVDTMRNYLLAQGVPAECIFMDHAGFDTYDTMYRARDVFQIQKAIVVTQEFHLLRALYIGQQLGLDVHGVASDPRVYARADFYRLREYLARSKAFIECEITHPQPRFLGEKIPISGDGRVTIDGK